MEPAFWGTPNAWGFFNCPYFNNFEHAVMFLAVHASSIKMAILPFLIHIIALQSVSQVLLLVE